mmetsp:Transcript_9202/g.22602  ORF Transcript_9202/g.22602 Transcript_9202/m.22602 type:complete len:418 (-) Transcript_9202:284-1537(-)|eukprot:CAMPEP_0114500966 /NCGR_PEP_ID=MMETSP0109-20121206/8246_1 /TAXON_ID=29199 /ORGANISM="Chlorarachnion reptans, Strain CCCM449" /LENGTH=417 /DNA_ID=CAMNT_0001678663 /DNA_START=167 /DNA_END=1420 /DNA_ORIENTATION=-
MPSLLPPLIFLLPIIDGVVVLDPFRGRQTIASLSRTSSSRLATLLPKREPTVLVSSEVADGFTRVAGRGAKLRSRIQRVKEARRSKVRNNNSLFETQKSLLRGYGPFFDLVPGKYVVNLFGVLFLAQQLFLASFWLLALFLTKLYYELIRVASINGALFDPNQVDRNFRMPDVITTHWAYFTLLASGCYPTYEGLENAPNDPALYVCNHASWMDMPIVGVMFKEIGHMHAGGHPGKATPFCSHELFKVIAKEELLKAPVLGIAIGMGEHVTLNRSDRRSQVKAFIAAKRWLDSGTNMITFPEGTRSEDGRMRSFRGGAFKIAISSKKKVVPVSLVSTHHLMPRCTLFPTVRGVSLSEDQEPRLNAPPLRVILHPPIDVEGKTEEEVAKEAFAAIASGLPDAQKPLNSTTVLVPKPSE